MKKRAAVFTVIGLALMLVSTHADTIILDSGKSITGKIIKDTPDEIVVKLPSGVTTTIDRDEVVEIKRAEDLEKEYRKKYKEITPGNTYAMLELAEWCRQRGLKKHQRELLKGILEIYPDDPDARRELDILEGKLPESARDKKTEPDEMIFAPGEGGLKKVKKKRKTRRIWGDRKSAKKTGKSRQSKFKPKGSTKAGLRGLDFLMKHGTRIKYAPQGQVVSAAFAGLACLASGNDKYVPLLDRCLSAVTKGLKRYLTGNRGNGSFNQSNWALSFGGFFLAEALHYYKTKELKSVLQRVCDQLVINMETSGGWAHAPDARAPTGYLEFEILSNFAVACMGMSKQEGLSVPGDKLARAIEYIEKCVNAKGVAYSLTNKSSRVSRSGGAAFALAMTGKKGDKYQMVCTHLLRMMQNVKFGHSTPALSYFQCAIGSLQAGRRIWDHYVKTWFAVILEHQEPDGSFRSIINPKESYRFETKYGPAFCTGIYSFILLVDLGYLKYCSGCARGK